MQQNQVMQPIVELNCYLTRETQAEFCFAFDEQGGDFFWVLKTDVQIEAFEILSNIYTITMPEWLAIDREIVDHCILLGE